jgi:hypothetical protein
LYSPNVKTFGERLHQILKLSVSAFAINFYRHPGPSTNSNTVNSNAVFLILIFSIFQWEIWVRGLVQRATIRQKECDDNSERDSGRELRRQGDLKE